MGGARRWAKRTSRRARVWAGENDIAARGHASLASRSDTPARLLRKRATGQSERPDVETSLTATKVPAARLLRQHSLTHRGILRDASHTAVQSLFFNSCRDTALASRGRRLVHGIGFRARRTGHRRARRRRARRRGIRHCGRSAAC